MDIVEVAKRTGVPASTLRFYEEKGLISSVGRQGLRRVFAPGVLQRLALIALGRSAGFSLDEIARMFAPDGQPQIDRRELAAKAAELDQTIRKTERDARRPSSRCRLPRPESHGVPDVSSPVAECGNQCRWRPRTRGYVNLAVGSRSARTATEVAPEPVINTMATRANAGAQAQTPTPGFNNTIPEQILTPNSVQTRIGTLEFVDGVPTVETTRRAYDNLDSLRGVEVFLNFVPATSVEAIRLGQVSMGASRLSLATAGSRSCVCTVRSNRGSKRPGGQGRSGGYPDTAARK